MPYWRGACFRSVRPYADALGRPDDRADAGTVTIAGTVADRRAIIEPVAYCRAITQSVTRPYADAQPEYNMDPKAFSIPEPVADTIPFAIAIAIAIADTSNDTDANANIAFMAGAHFGRERKSAPGHSPGKVLATY